MTAHEQLRHAIQEEELRLRAAIPPSREAVIRAILRIRDRLSRGSAIELDPDLITGHRLSDLGGNKALQLGLELSAANTEASLALSLAQLDVWAEQFLGECASLVEADLVLAHCETGFMRLVVDGFGAFDAWVATKRPPASWRERADIDWWAKSLDRRHDPEWGDRRSGPEPVHPGDIGRYRHLANEYLETMTWQLGYPASAAIGGCTIQTYRDVLGWLITWILGMHDHDEAITPQSESSLVAAVANGLGLDPVLAREAISAFTLDAEGAAWHASVPGIAAAPLLRVAPDRLVPSVYGLTTEPLLFLTRELRRRDAQAYHNAAHLREAVFRQDLYALFSDKRFVTSKGRIELRREGGTIRTDIDAAVFDRKTGTLALFELKSQDPFARSTAERVRQRDNVLFANRQVSGVLDWVKRHGANELLGRIDARTARTSRVHKVYPFVLGRYLVHFNDGPAPDRRAAWGTWPQVMRLVDGKSVRAAEANPIASLHTRLTNGDPIMPPPADLPSHEIPIGSARLTVHASWSAFQTHASGRGQPHQQA